MTIFQLEKEFGDGPEQQEFIAELIKGHLAFFIFINMRFEDDRCCHLRPKGNSAPPSKVDQESTDVQGPQVFG